MEAASSSVLRGPPPNLSFVQNLVAERLEEVQGDLKRIIISDFDLSGILISDNSSGSGTGGLHLVGDGMIYASPQQDSLFLDNAGTPQHLAWFPATSASAHRTT